MFGYSLEKISIFLAVIIGVVQIFSRVLKPFVTKLISSPAKINNLRLGAFLNPNYERSLAWYEKLVLKALYVKIVYINEVPGMNGHKQGDTYYILRSAWKDDKELRSHYDKC